jgi:protein-L-isoaspartate(D-aspartate) O-methyltransferase
MDFEAQREQMVQEQIFSRGILDARILSAMREIPRHHFIPEAQWGRAYDDRALPVGFEQTISQPYMVALMLKALSLAGHEKVLEIGAGGGYQAALLGRLAKEVHSVEIVPELAVLAEQRLRGLGLTNVQVHQRDGSGGLPEQAPYDAIVLAASAPEIPPPLVGQLKEGGKLLLPLRRGARDVLVLVEKHGGGLTRKDLSECAFVPLRGAFGTPAGEAPTSG